MEASDSVILGDLVDNTNPDCGDPPQKCADPIQTIKVSKVIPSKFNPKTLEDDILILKLEKPAKFNGLKDFWSELL